MSAVLVDKEVKIRKGRKCTKCGVFYPAGTKMHYTKSHHDFFQDEYVCSECWDKQSTETVTVNWETPVETTPQFKGTPDEYLELKRAERKAEREKKAMTCPDCGAPLIAKWSGVKCSKCSYWFCY